LRQALNILFYLAPFLAFAQQNTSLTHWRCPVKVPANYSKWRNNIINNNTATLQHDLCVNKKFSIRFYAVADENGNPNVSQSDMNTAIAILNNAFKRICVSFESCGLVVIPNHPYNRWTQDTIEPIVKKMWWMESTINLYMPDSIVGGIGGYASMPGGPGNEFVVISKGGITSAGLLIHEFGHFFGLPHTFDEIGPPASPAPPTPVVTNEFVRRTNCYTNGDGFCDTEADCYPVNEDDNAPCKNQHGAVDGFGEYYIPPVDNYMTYFACSCRFTQEQLNFMANTALTTLKYLH